MIFGSLDHYDRYSFLPNEIRACLLYAVENNLQEIENGKIELCGDDIFVNIMEFNTDYKDETIWEAHERYIDIHMVLRGQEKVFVKFTNNLEFINYNKANDFKEMRGTGGDSIVLNPGDFLICYPQDAHIPGIAANDKEFIKKATFKVRVK